MKHSFMELGKAWKRLPQNTLLNYRAGEGLEKATTKHIVMELGKTWKMRPGALLMKQENVWIFDETFSNMELDDHATYLFS